MAQPIAWITADAPTFADVQTRRWTDGWPQLVRTLTGQLQSDKLFEQICRDVVTGFGFSRSILATVDERNHRLVARAGCDPSLRTQAYMALVRLFQVPLAPRPDGRYLLAAWCVHRQEQVYVPDASTPSFRPDEVTQRPFVIKALGTTEYVLTPVVFRGRTIAVLGVDKKGSGEHVAPDERRLLLDIAALLALRLGPLLGAEESQRRPGPRAAAAARVSQDALLHGLASLGSLLDGLDEGLIVVSGDQRVQYANAPAATLLGVDRDELVGRPLQDVLRMPRPEEFGSLLRDAHSRGQSLRKRERLVAASGDEFEVHLRVLPLAGLDAQAILLVVGGDRVHHRRFQDEVFRSALHDLLAPIQSMVGFAELLQAGRLGRLTAEQAEFVERIVGGGEELIGFVERLMAVQHLESRDRQPIDVAMPATAAVDRVFARVEGKALRAGVLLAHEISGELPPLRGDESRLKAVFQNVLDNAIDAAEPGGTVRLTGVMHDDPRYIRFAVTEEASPPTGTNAPDMLSYDEDWTRTGAGRKRRSHGLGLAIVRRVVEGYGGEVWAQGEEEGELSITFTLPVAVEPVQPAGSAVTSE